MLLLPTSRSGNSRVAHTRPASNSPLASSTVTAHSRAPSSIAQSSDDGPRSPIGPGCTIRHRCRDQIGSGIIRFKNGHTISPGWCSATAASISASESTTATATSCPNSVNATHARWLRPLCAETKNRMRPTSRLIGCAPRCVALRSVQIAVRLGRVSFRNAACLPPAGLASWSHHDLLRAGGRRDAAGASPAACRATSASPLARR